MVSLRRHESPVGAGHSKKPSLDRAVKFSSSPVTSVSRPVSNEEHWALWLFEEHALNCDDCHEPYKVHKLGQHLCDAGHKLAQGVARYIFRRRDGELYSTIREDHMDVRVELPHGYEECYSLLRAIHRAARHNQTFVSVDRTYLVSPRGLKRSNTVHIHNPAPEVREPSSSTKTGPPEKVVLEWPRIKRSDTNPEPTSSEAQAKLKEKRGSLYYKDQAAYHERREREQRLNYELEVREPPKHLRHNPNRRPAYYT